MTPVQVIEKNGKPEYDVVPDVLWNKMREAVEGLDDVAVRDAAVRRATRRRPDRATERVVSFVPKGWAASAPWASLGAPYFLPIPR